MIKQCSCGKKITGLNALNLIGNDQGVWFTCPDCQSTGIIKNARLAKCTCGGSKYHKCHSTISDEKLPFYKKGNGLFDEYYCGAWGWD